MTQSQMPEFAPFVALAFLGTAGLAALSAVGAMGAVLLGRRALARRLGAAGLLAAAAYFGVLLAFSFLSKERTLRPGDRKVFCELDCHLAYWVESATVSPEGRGLRYAVILKVWFDPSTTSSFRGDAPLTGNPRVAFLQDPAGRRYAASPTALQPLTRPLRPGESFETALVFDAAPGALKPRLFLGDPPGVENLLIGHENSPFHRKIFFELPPAEPARSR